MFESIVVGTDGSERATRAVEMAADLAAKLGATLHVVQAYKGVEEAMASAMASGMVTAPRELADVAMDEADTVAAALEKLAAGLRDRGITVETHAVVGAPATVILETAANLNADLVVVGNRGMTGAKRILGSVPNTLAHRSDCAVLIARTDD